MTNENKPVKKFRAGGVSAALWKNTMKGRDGNDIQTVSATIERRYKDKDGNWQSSGSLRLNDVPKAVLVLGMAYKHMLSGDEDGSTEHVPEEEVVA